MYGMLRIKGWQCLYYGGLQLKVSRGCAEDEEKSECKLIKLRCCYLGVNVIDIINTSKAEHCEARSILCCVCCLFLLRDEVSNSLYLMITALFATYCITSIYSICIQN